MLGNKIVLSRPFSAISNLLLSIFLVTHKLNLLPRKCSVIKLCCRELSHQQIARFFLTRKFSATQFYYRAFSRYEYQATATATATCTTVILILFYFCLIIWQHIVPINLVLSKFQLRSVFGIRVKSFHYSQLYLWYSQISYNYVHWEKSVSVRGIPKSTGRILMSSPAYWRLNRSDHSGKEIVNMKHK